MDLSAAWLLEHCPYCGERQSYQEAKPSKPYVVKYWGLEPETRFDTLCRACSKRMVWHEVCGTANGSWVSELYSIRME